MIHSHVLALLPIVFEPNLGQSASPVKFLAEGPGYRVFLTPSEAVFKQKADGSVLRLRLVGANPVPQGAGLDPQAEKHHYFIGHDPRGWHTDVPTFARVLWREVYPGVDLVYYGRDGQLECDFVVRPGADPRRIRFHFPGASVVEEEATGDLLLGAGRAEARLRRPSLYQERGGGREAVSGRYVVDPEGGVGFEVGTYDAARTLVIDPVVEYSTYLGSRGEDAASAVAVDERGNTYVVGSTSSLDFPAGLEPASGSIPPVRAFVIKLRPDGQGVVYAAHLGGSVFDAGLDVAVDEDGNAYVTGNTASPDFPTVRALQPTHGGGLDAFVAKLSADGSKLRFATFLGGTGDEFSTGIATDEDEEPFVTGSTTSRDFPTEKAIQPSHGGGDFDAYVARLDRSGRRLSYSSYLGGSGDDFGFGVAADEDGRAYLTGQTSSIDFPTRRPLQSDSAGGRDMFVAKLNRAGTSFVYATYLGGSGDDFGNSIKSDEHGNAYVGGDTTSSDFPTRNPLQAHNAGGDDAVVAKLNSEGSALVYATYLGGSGNDIALRVAVDEDGRAYVAGVTDSPDFPTVKATQPSFGGTGGGIPIFRGDGLLAALSSNGRRLGFSTYLGGSNDEYALGLAVDECGAAYVAGATTSRNFPTKRPRQAIFGGGPSDGFLTKVSTREDSDDDSDDDDDCSDDDARHRP